jgi:membrane associated rhomboid family serine protease
MCGAQGHYAARSGGADDSLALFGAWPVTMILMTANLAVYAFVLYYQSQFSTQSGEPGSIGFEPRHDIDVLGAFGSVSAAVRATHEWWRLIAYAFLHGGVLHIAMNMFGLWQAGRIAEEIWGRAQYVMLYLLSGIGGGLLVMMGKTSAVGASGAIFGLIAALAAHGYRHSNLALQQYTVSWLLYGLAMSFSPRVSMAGHVGGAIIGALLGWFMPDEDTLRQSIGRVRLAQALAALGIVATLGSGAVVARNLKTYRETFAIQGVSHTILSVASNLSERYITHLLAGFKYFPKAFTEEDQQSAPKLFEETFGRKTEQVSNDELNKKLNLSHQAVCGEIGTLERMALPDAEFGLIQQQLTQAVRVVCQQPAWRAETITEPNVKALNSRDAAFDAALLAYWQWMEKRAAQAGLATSDLLPNDSYERFARGQIKRIQQARAEAAEEPATPKTPAEKSEVNAR